jgi:DNA-damage-inducible protein D
MTNNSFEAIKHINKYDSEYWKARELAKVLEYSEYRFLISVIDKAKTACKNTGQLIEDHFEDVHDMVQIGSGAKRKLPDIHLSRYACYLIVQNADPSKEVVALGQTYFAIQTRRQEVSGQFMEDQRRVLLREDIKGKNKKLAKVATNAGVLNYGIFQNFGYMGLYGGLTQEDIHKRKKLKKSQRILDHMGSEELGANIFRITQADAKLKREGIIGQEKANRAHFVVGETVRKTIHELGGNMPENLPTPDSVKKAEKRIKTNKKRLKSPNA